MIEENVQITVSGQQFPARWLRFEDTDRQGLRNLYGQWHNLSTSMRTFHARGVNFPEGISEGLFALQFDSPKIISLQGNTSVSFDCYNLQRQSRIQVKATSVEDDLTSFGPRSVWDELFFMDFFHEGNFDGRYAVYHIPNDLILNFPINANQTFQEQQLQGRRPRLHVKSSIIGPNNLAPVGIFSI